MYDITKGEYLKTDFTHKAVTKQDNIHWLLDSKPIFYLFISVCQLLDAFRVGHQNDSHFCTMGDTKIDQNYLLWSESSFS